MKNKKNWVIAIILTVAAGFVTVKNNSAPAVATEITEAAFTNPSSDISITAAHEDCAYMWAYHDAPELTNKVQEMIGGLAPKATARASLYGEDCVYADGHANFSVMETDFYIHIPVDDLSNEATLGNWLSQVMPLIIKIPQQEIQGNYGFVEFWFEKNGTTEQVLLRVPIQKYKDEAQGKNGIELYKIFSKALPY